MWTISRHSKDINLKELIKATEQSCEDILLARSKLDTLWVRVNIRISHVYFSVKYDVH